MSRRRKKRPHKQISARQATAARVAPESPSEVAETGKEVSKLSPEVAALTRRDSESSWTPLLAGFLVFLISTPAIVGPYGQTIGYSPDLHMAAYIQVGGALILSLFLISCFALKRIVVLRSPILLPMVLFYAWAMLSVLWADYKYDAIVDALDWTGAFLGGMLVVLLLRDIKLLHRLFLFLLVSGVLMALLGISQYLFGIDWVLQHSVPAATFGNKNMAGQYGVIILPIAVAFFLYSKSEAKVWAFAIITSLIMTYIFYTHSRGALLALLTEMIFLSGILIYLKRKHEFHILGDMPTKKVALASALALFVGLSALTPSMLGNLSEVLEASSVGSKLPELKVLKAEHGGESLRRADSADTRITMWGNSIPMFKDHFLIGVGMGNWTKHYGAYQNWYKPDESLLYGEYHANAHNDYVEILCEFGIIGFALFLWLIVALFRAMGCLLASRDKECYLLIVAVVLAVMGIGMNAAFSFPLKQPVPIFIMMVYIAMISNMYGAKFEVGREYVIPRPSKPAIGVAAVVAIIATASLFVLQYNWYFSEIHYRNAVVSLSQANYKNTHIEARRAYELNPLRTELLWFKANSLLASNPSARNKEIVSMLEAVVASRPYLPRSALNLAQAYANVGRYNDAAETLGRMVKVQPSSFRIRFKYGLLLFNAGRYEEAIKILEEVRPELDPKWMKQRMALDQLDEVILMARGQVARAKAREAKTSETDAVSPSQ